MNVKDLCSLNFNHAKAYILGMIYPLYKKIEYDNKNVLLGSVNHNNNMINVDDLVGHFQKIIRLLKKYNIPSNIIKNNDQLKGVMKKGFSIVIEANDPEFDNLINKEIDKIIKETTEIKKYFLIGCFDGRSSYDKTAKYLSVDIDRDYIKQDKIKEIAESLGIDINLNRRDCNHKKNDQMRIKRDSLKKFFNSIGLLSIRRSNILKEEIIL
jgi:hypothetical protein